MEVFQPQVQSGAKDILIFIAFNYVPVKEVHQVRSSDGKRRTLSAL